MTVLVTGATGMLGQKLMGEAAERDQNAIGIARRGADVDLDLTDDDALAKLFEKYRPNVVINSAALVDIDLCDKNPSLAWRLNARAVSVLTDLCRRYGARLVQVSTEHYFTGDGNTRHDENHPVTLLNDYARFKFAAEAFAGCDPMSLIARVNIVGLRGWQKPTFAEWAIKVIEEEQDVTLFDDAFVSCLHTAASAKALFDLIEAKAHGIYNVASRDVFSKKQFIEALAAALGKSLSNAKTGSVGELAVKRAESLGLDVGKAERTLGYNLPTLKQVVRALATEHKIKS